MWMPSSISFELLGNVLNSILATPFSCEPQNSDSLMWAYSKNGSFSIQAAYLIERGLNPLNSISLSFKCVWKTDTFPKIQFLIWLCLHNSLPTTYVLGSRGLNLDTMCKVCNKIFETIEHLFKGCEFTLQF